MDRSNIIERRDPCAPIIRLGSALSEARREQKSGWIEIQDKGKIHGIQVNGGAIANVVTEAAWRNDLSIHQQAIRLFSLPRPNVHWIPDATTASCPPLLDPTRIVLSGLTTRQDLFDPRILAQRIPVQTLHIKPELLNRLRNLPLNRTELEFLYSLRIPTPIPMILWKRGLTPSYAGALLVALNIMGLWKDQWEPGLLPRISAAVKIIKKMEAGASDFDILNLGLNSSAQDQDRAFRKLSLELHPDRLSNMPDKEKAMAGKAFEAANGAYHRIKHSRRRRPVRGEAATPIARVKIRKRMPDNWNEMLQEAQVALANGDYRRAKSFALKGLSLSPPPSVKRELTALFAKVA